MKNTIVILVIMSAFLFSTNNSFAQKNADINTTEGKILVDNNIMTAKEVTFAPGKPTDVHTHPAHFVYALTDGTLVVTMKSGEVTTWDLKTGDSAYIEPEGPHSTVNSGKSVMKILLIELKEYPYMSQSKMETK